MVEVPNLVFAGTTVTSGWGRAVVFATAMGTEFGKIANLTQTVAEELSPLQKEMIRVTRIVAVLAVGMGILFFVLGSMVVGLPLIESFIFAIGLIVANVPEGLLPTVTLSLAMGVQRMARRHALIKRLSSVETLGSTTVICTDKTGTLTQNEMTVREGWVDGRHFHISGVGYKPKGQLTFRGTPLSLTETPILSLLLECASFCNNARLVPPRGSEGWSILGDPTEGALLVAAAKAYFDRELTLKTKPRIYEFPFDSVRKRMTTIHRGPEGVVAYTKGSPKEVLALSRAVITERGVEELTGDVRQKILEQNDEFARAGLRVLAMAYRPLGEDFRDLSAETVENDLIFIGLIAMLDPPRVEVEEAVKKCAAAGIRVIMITGDYGLTAESIARRIGIVKGRGAKIITGMDLDRLSDEELKVELSREQIIFARVTPEHKLRIVTGLKEQGHVVAVTGDGVNDAPALKKADIGVAMGIAGTDVAKEAADMILTDDNFASIVAAIEEGRAVYDNIKKFVTYIFASNVPEIIPFIAMVLFQIPLPLTVMQILAVDLGTDMLPALALGTEAPEPGVMSRPPRSRGKRLLDLTLLLRAYAFLGMLEAVLSLSAYFWYNWVSGWQWGQALFSSGLAYRHATSMTLAGIVATQVGNAFCVRSERESVFRLGLFSNRFLLVGIGVELTLIALLVYFPPLGYVFSLAPLDGRDWLFLALFPPIMLGFEELRKLIVRRFRSKG